MKVRTISAIIMLIIIIPIIYFGGIVFSLGVCIAAALAYKEVINLKESHNKYPPTMVFLGFFSMISYIFSNTGASIYTGITYQIMALSLLLLLIPVIFYSNDEYTTKDAFYLLGVTFLLGVVFNTFIIIRSINIYLFIYLLILPMVTDVCAMIGGKYFGKNKMCPKLSPKKTWEGSVVGLLGGSIVSLIFYVIFVGRLTVLVVVLTVLMSLIGQMGDLIMSKIKRENKIKDFSNIMPGHGGVLDRLDSVIFVFLAYMFLLII